MKRMCARLLALILIMSLLAYIAPRAGAESVDKLVALTFDDGPSSRYTEQLLDGLAERDVPVTFFMLGNRAEDNPGIVRRAYEEGHEIACHSWDHPDLTALSSAGVRAQMEMTFTVLDEACGAGTAYLVRPPYGSTNERVRGVIDAPLIYWSVDSRDWELRDAEKVRDKIVEESYDGCVILCHDIHEETIPAALEVIDLMRAEGYEFVTVSELYRRRGLELEDHELHYNARPGFSDPGPIPAPELQSRYNGDGTFTVTITCGDGSVPIYYTLDGSYPNQEAAVYTEPLTVDYFTEIAAVAAWNLNGSRSQTVYLRESDYPCFTPDIEVDPAGRLHLSTDTPGAEIRYTLDGTDPVDIGNLYTETVTIPGGSLLRWAAIHPATGVSPERGTWYYSEEGQLYADMSPDDWFYDAVARVHQAGILNGTGDYTMGPTGTLTRGMLVTLLQRYSGESLGAIWERTNTFADVPQDSYYAEAVEWAYRSRIVSGCRADSFGPDDPVTREQMCTIVAGFLEYMDMPLLPGRDVLDGFADESSIAPWARDSVAALVRAGLIQGSGAGIDPTSSANRAQFCTILSRVMDYAENYVPRILVVPFGAMTAEEGTEADVVFTYTADSADLKWSSDAPAVATVDETGTVTAWAPGEARITVTDGLSEAVCIVHVEAASPAVERFWFSGANETVVTGRPGGSAAIVVRPLPDGGEDVSIISADPNVAAVRRVGTEQEGCTAFSVEFVSEGTTDVTVTAANGAATLVLRVEVFPGCAIASGENRTPGQLASSAAHQFREAAFAGVRGGSWQMLRCAARCPDLDSGPSPAGGALHTWWPTGGRDEQVVYIGSHDGGSCEFRILWN